MANILQVTNPALNTETRNIGNNPALNNPLAGQEIKNPVDPSRVTRADGRDNGQNDGMAGDKGFGVAGYDSNYGAFIQRLAQGTNLTELLGDLFGGSRLMAKGDEQVRELVSQLLTSVRFSSPEELAGFLRDQAAGQAKFSGPFFDKMRSLLLNGTSSGLKDSAMEFLRAYNDFSFLRDQAAGQAKFSGPFFDKMRSLLLNGTSSGLKDSAMEFLRAYNDFSAGQHLLGQMRSLSETLSSMLIPSVREEFGKLLREMDWAAENGQTEKNVSVLYGKLIPFLSRYVARTHDYGGVRSMAMLLIFRGVQYENGEEKNLTRLFERMAVNREFARFFPEEPTALLESLLRGDRSQSREFADAFSTMLLRGMNGEAGLEQVQPFYQLLNGLLLNESVYLPLMHLLLPFQYEDREVMSEMWIDPDAEKRGEEEAGGRKIKFLLRFDIQETGSFEMAVSVQERKVKMGLSVPPALMDQKQEIQKKMTEIFRNNGMEINQLFVKEKRGEARLEEVFPEILRKEKAINVRV